MKRLIIFIIALAVPAAAHAAADDFLFRPDGGTVAASRPFFLWQVSSADDPATFRVTVDGGKGMSPFFEGTPQSYKGFLYLVSPRPLAPGSYSYELFPLYDGKPSATKFFGPKKYPLKGRFTASAEAAAADPVREIDFLAASEDNVNDNGINALFFGGGALVCGGVAALLFSVFDYNIWTRVAGYAFAAGAVTGAGASVYCSSRYLLTKRGLEQSYRPLRERGIQLCFSTHL